VTQRTAIAINKEKKPTRLVIAKPHTSKFLPGIARMILTAAHEVNSGEN